MGWIGRHIAACAAATFLVGGPAHGQDLTWEVLNPFRFYKDASAFRLHEDAFKAVAANGAADNSQIIRRIDRCLNDPSAVDPALRAACAAVVREHRVDARLGWAASTLGSTCYDRLERPRKYPAECERERAGRRVREDYVLPESHAVSIGLAPARLAAAGSERCVWSWKPRSGGAWQQSDPQPCTDRKVVDRVPFSTDRAASGLEVKVELSGGRSFREDVIVDDLLIAAIGDSFASGEGNPDQPVAFSASRGMDYRRPRCEPATAAMAGSRKGLLRTLGSPASSIDPYVLPRRYMRDEQQGLQYDFCDPRFNDAFWEKSAQWLSPDCHRSQYAFPMRVSLQLALEDRHRAVTLIHLACSGAQVTDGLFKSLDARQHYDPSRKKTKTVTAQFEQLTRLICRVDARVPSEGYPVQAFKSGDTRLFEETLRGQWCPSDKRKREIDLVLLSIGGNDIGFSAVAAYTFLDHARDIAPLAGMMERQLRFGPEVAETYLRTLDSRMVAVQKALRAGYGIDPSRVIHVSYENVEYDEAGRLCGDPERAMIGMDVHPRFKLDAGRVAEVHTFLGKLFTRLQCVTEANGDCPKNLKTGEGTRFTLVVDHQPEFLRRGICARDPAHLAADAQRMSMPRVVSGSFTPYLPSDYRPYAHRMHLFRTPNDSFLTANEHRASEAPLFDILQPAVAALLSGAFHPTAEAHAIVADHVLAHARRILAQR
jgi:hypothetical protein